MRKIVLFFLLIASLTSCATIENEGAPEWVIYQPKILGSVVFIGEGVGVSRDSAKSDAYEDALDLMSDNLGRDLSYEYLRELLTTNQLEELSTEVTGEYAIEDGPNSWRYYVMTVTPAKSFLNSRSPEYLALLDREAQIASKLDESLDYYSDNRDSDAIESLLDAVLISLSGDVNNPEYTPDVLMEKAVEYISRLRITVDRTRQGRDEVTVRLKRARGLFYPSVVGGYVYGSYQAVNSIGEVNEEGFIAKTNDKGRFFFSKTDPYMKRIGSFVFSPYFDRAKLDEIRLQAPDGFLDSFDSTISSLSVSHEYSSTPKLYSSDFLFSISLYDISGNQVPRNIIERHITSQLRSVDIDGLSTIEGYGEDNYDTYTFLKRLYPNRNYYFVLRAGITDYQNSSSKVYVRSEARFVLYNNDGEVLKTQDYYTTGDGATFSEGANAALEKLGRISAGFLLEEL